MIMVVSLLFSAVIYRALTFEFERFERMQRMRIERDFESENSLRPQGELRPRLRALITGPDPELIQEAKDRVLYILVGVNAGILIIAGGIGYFLAGRTLQPIQDMVQEQNRFISDASHELRTPLTSLRTSFEVYLRDPSSSVAEAREIITDSVEDVKQLQTLTDALLELSQFQKPEAPPMEPLQIENIIKQAIRRVKPLAKNKHIVVTNDTVPGSVTGNNSALTDVFMLLLDNAIKYSPEHSTIIVSSEQKDGVVKLYVKDQGMGIDKTDIPHIFERFYRADTARTGGTTHGYGLGLSIAKRIIELHNGSISVTSTKGAGSTFCVIFPLAKSSV